MPTRRTLITTLASATVALTLAACGGASSNATSSATSSAPVTSTPASKTPAGRTGDISFAQQMIPHHRQAVLMADMALRNKTASAKVRSLATEIKKAQGPEITTMTGWLTRWNAPTTSAMSGMSGMDGMHDMEGMMSKEDMTSLGAATGATFNRQWLTMMLAHHRGAITMSNNVLKTTSTPSVQQLARSIISGQTTEITTMRTLLASTA
ncbi:DUF305 domain-containing protein [Dermatophilaceae bacterium Sec6.4]